MGYETQKVYKFGLIFHIFTISYFVKYYVQLHILENLSKDSIIKITKFWQNDQI